MADALAKLDGLQIQSVDYASSKEDETKVDALKQALVNAHDKASEWPPSPGARSTSRSRSSKGRRTLVRGR